MNQLNNTPRRYIEKYIRVIHYNEDVIPMYNVNRFGDNIDLRIQYMMNKIDKEKFKKSLQQREKKRLKYNEIRGVLEMYTIVMTDILQRYLKKNTNCIDDSINREMEEILNYANSSLKDIGKIYNSKTIAIS